MPAPRRGAALVALTICLLPAGPGARADELLVMPYACTAAGGRTVLAPGPERGHRIIGHREERRFTACSPVNPSLCRNWTVHRFDLDCDGTRVPWVSVVAAAGEMNRRAWLMDGRLQLRMGPRWSLAPDDPCVQEAEADRRFAYRRMRRYCADRLAMAPPPVVEMPLGFAPMLGIDGIFVKAAAGVAKAPPPLPPIVAAPPPPDGDAQPPRRMAEPPPQPSPLASPGAAIAPPPRPERADRPAPAPQDPKRAVPAPKPAPRVAEVPPPHAPQVPKAAPDPEPAPKTAATPPPKQVAVRGPPPPKTAAEPEGKTIALNVLSVLRTTTTGAIVAFAGLALGLLAAFALARRRERMAHARMRPRDIASLSLGRRAKAPARLDHTRGRVPPNAAAPPMSRVPDASTASALAGLGDRMPATRAEALRVLGLGVAPGANATAIKKIVDALRVGWHPDLAKDEADRQLRELRSKQINAAWDLLQSQRAEAR